MLVSSLALTAPPKVNYRPLWWAVLISVLVHGVVVFGVRFVVPEASRWVNTVALDVVLMNSKSETAPEKPDVLAQTNLDGGGNTDKRDQRAATPLPPQTTTHPERDLQLKEAQQKNLENEAEQLMRELSAQGRRQQTEIESRPRLSAPLQGFDRASLLNQARDIARLEGEIAQRHHAYQTRPRRAFFGGRAREARFAHYVEDWRLKIERIGNMNYPQAAREQEIHGKLILSVEIHADGRLGRLKVERSSGHAVLDEAAQRIVELGAPYARFPEELARDYDILTIVRTWSFTRENELANTGR